MMNVITLCQRLIQFPSITPKDEGILSFIVSILEPLGFQCNVLPFEDNQGQTIYNLYARKGTTSPNLCFAGHVDVVPTGNEGSWSSPPFSGRLHNQAVWGRGAVDMKGAIAAFISAVQRINMPINGSISLLITGDEEGPATHGTIKVIEWLNSQNEIIDFCIVGEPTSDALLGDTIKIGRRGSLSGKLTVKGTQGHVAYPEKADNPIPKMLSLLNTLQDDILDQGYPDFQPSNLEITSIDVGNTATNVIPELITANFNCRFNPTYTQISLKQHLIDILDAKNIPYFLSFQQGSDPFRTSDHYAINCMKQAIQDTTGIQPTLSTSGGTSDARFICNIAPVLEFGLSNTLAHKVDEHVSIKDLETLSKIYERFITLYFQFCY